MRVIEQIDDWVSLLEIIDNPAIGISLGEGVMQFVIRPDDLLAGRLDKVKLVISAH